MSSSSSEPCYAFIYHNGNGLMESYSYEYKDGYNEAASNTMVRQLKVGDRVWIEVLANTYCYGYPYTGFSGWKL
ncbi:hypothetical protein FSP39_012696 [Pinctada imbricata]|uniref:C1q domain-containing protein n=1 Tax=Pinctada imbricata TaxID=66713 RepID=A0AA88YR88_PINIB|nr:hypothetical protein FSP39_012696 [Pinctada imbricata]